MSLSASRNSIGMELLIWADKKSILEIYIQSRAAILEFTARTGHIYGLLQVHHAKSTSFRKVKVFRYYSVLYPLYYYSERQDFAYVSSDRSPISRTAAKSQIIFLFFSFTTVFMKRWEYSLYFVVLVLYIQRDIKLLYSLKLTFPRRHILHWADLAKEFQKFRRNYDISRVFIIIPQSCYRYKFSRRDRKCGNKLFLFSLTFLNFLIYVNKLY